jgi:predicted metal-binding protein
MIKVCKHCNKKFRAQRGNQAYCCGQCRNKAKKLREKARKKPKLEVRECIMCGEEFMPIKGRNNKRDHYSRTKNDYNGSG